MSDDTTTNKTIFDDNGVNDTELGVVLFSQLGLSDGELSSPMNQMKIKEISAFLDGHPDPLFVVNSVLRSNTNPDIKNVDHLLTFVKLQTQKQGLVDQLEENKKQLSFYV